MTHIANCIRLDADASNVYIPQETSVKLPRSKSLRSLQAPKESYEKPLGPLEQNPSVLSLPLQASSRYQLFPVPSAKSPVAGFRPTQLSDKLSALSMGRSPTSLSDTSVPQESVPFWHRAGSISRRRKISVPELGNTMTTVQEMAIDSPTIPGRPPLRKASTESFGHERSSSAPGTSWREGPFGDALMSCISGPVEQRGFPESSSTIINRGDASTPIAKPLSPILSPTVAFKPTLKVDTTNATSDIDGPPEVPPKSPHMERRGSPAPLILSTKSSRTQLVTSASGVTPTSALDMRRSPNTNAPLPTPLSAASNPFSLGSPSSAGERRASPRVEKRDPFASHVRNASDTSILDRGRPTRRSSKRQRSRTCSEAANPDAVAQDTWKLPKGLPVHEASDRMSSSDKDLLHKQALDQAEKFEVFSKRDVGAMSRELRALDERCDYLRKTYKSLRAGRQKLHGRMISYLKRGETVIFSRESLLKQEEALAELDVSIDEFILKLEQAENRRLRLRQKLLEHVAAALVLSPSSMLHDVSESTPPRSPIKAESPSRLDRKDVESIKIYADGHVLNLFSDIEEAIGKMCEQQC